MKSGGAFYSSGPSLLEENLEFGVNEPWIGQWKDDLLKVTCKDQQKTPFRELTKHPEYVVTTDQGSSCEENELCVPREMCPTHNDTYNKLKTLPKNSKEAKEIIKNLRKKVDIYLYLAFLEDNTFTVHFYKSTFRTLYKEFTLHFKHSLQLVYLLIISFNSEMQHKRERTLL